MTSQPNSKRIGRMFDRPSNETIESVKTAIKEEAVVETDTWQRFVSSSDRSAPGTLFSNPPEKFIAKLSYGDLVYCWLLEDNDEHGYLCYLMNTGSMWTTVYVYKGKTPHQRHMISSVYRRNDVDWRVVPVTARNSSTPSARKMKVEWSAWIFHHYFAFDWFPEP